MNTLAGLLTEAPIAPDIQGMPSIQEAAVETVRTMGSVRDEQIQSLVHQLFFRPAATPVRHVGFVAADPETETAQLCLDVATALAGMGTYDVGLIDARLQSVALHTQLEITPDRDEGVAWQIAPRLWLAPRRIWLDDSPSQRVWDPSLAQLRTATMEFDYSIVCFDPISWVTTRISQTCDGLVLVLTANRTRRLVAAQIREQMKKARVSLLGTVLAQRQFPVPEGLYRKL